MYNVRKHMGGRFNKKRTTRQLSLKKKNVISKLYYPLVEDLHGFRNDRYCQTLQ